MCLFDFPRPVKKYIWWWLCRTCGNIPVFFHQFQPQNRLKGRPNATPRTLLPVSRPANGVWRGSHGNYHRRFTNFYFCTYKKYLNETNFIDKSWTGARMSSLTTPTPHVESGVFSSTNIIKLIGNIFGGFCFIRFILYSSFVYLDDLDKDNDRKLICCWSAHLGGTWHGKRGIAAD